MKLWKKVILIIVAVILALLLGFVAFSHIVWHRTSIATIAEWVVLSGGSKKIFTDPDRCESYIQGKDAINREPYAIPDSVKFSVPLEERQESNMQVFVLNADGASDTVVLYIHGGAYINNPSVEQWRFCNTLSKDLGMTVVFPIYPLEPVYNCEYAYECMVELYRHYVELYSGKRMILMGDSAGGGFSLGLAQVLREEAVTQPEQLILLSPWIDLTMENEDMIPYEKVDPMLGIYGLKAMGEIWADDLDVTNPMVSPIYGDMDGLGRISLFVGTREIFYPEIMRLDQKLTEAGIDHDLYIGEGMNHVYPVYPIPEGAEAIKTIETLITG